MLAYTHKEGDRVELPMGVVLHIGKRRGRRIRVVYECPPGVRPVITPPEKTTTRKTVDASTQGSGNSGAAGPGR